MENSPRNNGSPSRERYFRWMFLSAAVWNLVSGVAVLALLRNVRLRMELGFPAATDAIASELLACCLFVFGLGY
jgi:hypothetical protein